MNHFQAKHNSGSRRENAIEPRDKDFSDFVNRKITRRRRASSRRA
jgi:hypothetical protein